MDVVLAGIGTAVPRHEISQTLAGEASAAYCCDKPDQARLIEGLYRFSGVETRRLVILNRSDGTLAERQEFYTARTPESPAGPTTGERLEFFERAAGPLAVEAATKALEQSGVESRSVTHLVTVSCSGFSAPGFDYVLIDQLPMKPTVARTQVGFMGCHAALNALRVARAFVAADPKAVVLVCCVELCSLHYQYGWNPEQIVANALFSDGAAACVIQSADADRAASGRPFRILASGSTAQHLHPWLSEWLGNHGHRPESIGAWAVHPGGPRILQAFTEAMRLDSRHVDISRDILRQHGNMSSATLLFILDRLRASRAEGPFVAIGFGPGLAAEATLLD